MKKRKAIGPVNLLLLVSAVGLLLFSGIGGARAAMNYVSEQAALRIESGDIDVELRENGKKVPDGTLLSGMEEAIQPGRAYEEELTVHNSGDQDEYVRVTLYRCWTVGRKRQTTLSPELIDPGTPGKFWTEDPDASTAERTVYYYTQPLTPGETTEPLFETLTIRPDVLSSVTLSEDGKAATYDYNDVSFLVRVEADAVQTHSAEDAILSAWGVHMTADKSGALSLKQ